MKKIIAVVVLLVLGLIGGMVYQVNEKAAQDELYEEATVFFREEDYKKAIQYFEEAKTHDNLFSGSLKKDLLYYQAEAHMKLEEYGEAMKIYDSFISESPKETIPYVMKAYCLIGYGEAESAASIYQQGYENTKDPEFLYYQANQYVTMESFEDALHIIDTYRNVDEEVVRKLAFLEIVVYEKQQDYKTAYEKACSYCESYPEDEQGQKEKIFLESRQ